MIHDGKGGFCRRNRTDLLPRVVYLDVGRIPRLQRQVVMKRSLWFDASMLAIIVIAAIVSGIH
jgi:uncharacterized membrane protein